MTKRIVLLTTGGTIATTTDRSTRRSAPTLGARVAELADVEGIEVTVEEVTSIASWRLDPLEMARIAIRATTCAALPDVDGVVITHGTTTLEYTAFLTAMVVTGEAPVVLTGSMRRANAPAPDGPANLRDAMVVATDPAARGLGALVVFAGRIIAAGSAWKANRSEVDAFIDLGGSDVGTITGDKVTIERRPSRPRPFGGALEPRVALVKLTPGADGTQILAAAASGARGLVVEALPGSGGVPPRALDALRSAAGELIVVVASRAPLGQMPDAPTGGTGEPLSGMPLLSARSLSAEQAWLLLMLVLGESPDFGAAARERFETVAAGAATTNR